MAIMEELNQGIKDAMKSRDQVRLDVLRMLKTKVMTVNARGDLPDADIQKLFKTYFGNIQEAYEQAKGAGRTDISDRLHKELEIIQEFLPKTLSHEETKKLVVLAIADSGAKTRKDVGLVMRSLMKMGKPIDGKLASELAAQLLGD